MLQWYTAEERESENIINRKVKLTQKCHKIQVTSRDFIMSDL